MKNLFSPHALAIAILFFAQYIAATVIVISDDKAFDEQVMKSAKPTVVKFASEWCGVCKGVKKPFEELSNEKDLSHVQFANVDANSDATKKVTDSYKVEGVPTFIFILNGKKVDEHVGVRDMKKFKDDMRASVQKNFPKSAQTQIDAQDDANAATDKTESVLNKIATFLKQLVDAFINFIKYIVEAVRGLFK